MMNQQEFTAAVLAAEPTLYRVAKAMVGNEEDCADAAQQAILRAWERLDTLRQPQYFRTWLTRILINECKGILRQRGRQAPYDQAAAEAIPAPAEEDHSDSTQRWRLEEKYRLPVVMYYWEGFKTREIAPFSACRRERPEKSVRKALVPPPSPGCQGGHLLLQRAGQAL